MPTRRDVLKVGGGAVIAGLAGSCATKAGVRPAAAAVDAVSKTPVASPRAAARPLRTRGAGPLYWSTYGYENEKNVIIPESVWKENIDWLAATFRDDGYTMACTDGWIDNTQKITKHGYIVSQADDWEHDWAWWAKYLRRKGLGLGVYYNPLWVTKSAVDDPAVKVVGRPDVKVGDIVNPGDLFNGGTLFWLDASRDGAEEYVKGYVDYFRRLGAVFLRVDFLAFYESGFDQNEGTVGVAHGRQAYVKALEWMADAAGDMQISLVMPNLFDHGAAERQYGDLIRIDNDASFGTWYNLSLGRQTWQPEWSQWNNPFLGFTGYADVSGRGQVILDGDPLIMKSFQNDTERQTAINLFTIAGAPIAIADRVDTIGTNAHVFQNAEVLALRTVGVVGKPVFNNSHPFEFDPSSRDPERWIGQLADGRWAVALFNREETAKAQSIDFATVLGVDGAATVRDLWTGHEYGPTTQYQVALAPRASVLLLVTPRGRARFQAEVGAWQGDARFENHFAGHTGMGYVTGLDAEGSSVAVAIAASRAGKQQLLCRVANSTGHAASLTVRALDPVTGAVHGTGTLAVPSAAAWTTWRTVSVPLAMAAGTNLVVCSVEGSDQGAVNLDHLALG